jgi:hypothetical protein
MNQTNKRLLILTGPQGSGNHLWSKIFSEDPIVQGWEELKTTYWVSHGNEPFSAMWEDPSLFLRINWNKQYYVTSISCPYLPKGGPRIDSIDRVYIPKYLEFIEQAEASGFSVDICIIGRDQNVLSHQQQRIRGAVTWPLFLDEYTKTIKSREHFFISTELLYLYKEKYVSQISKSLNWPMRISQEKIEEILKEDPNEKYFNAVQDHWLDAVITADSQRNGDPENPYRYRVSK